MNYHVCGRKLLIVEDDEQLKGEIVEYFSADNAVLTASDIGEAVNLLTANGDIDVVVLDLILKNSMGMDLFGAFQTLPPVVILSSLDDEESIYTGLTTGAVNYIVKPCPMRLLDVHVAMRLLPKADAEISVGDFYINSNSRIVKYCDAIITLTPSEFNILFFLVKNRGKYYTADEMYEEIWCAPSLHTTTIRAHLSSLRRKLKNVSESTDIIRTEFNKGYCFTGENL